MTILFWWFLLGAFTFTLVGEYDMGYNCVFICVIIRCTEEIIKAINKKVGGEQ
jgi:hypothetical protein